MVCGVLFVCIVCIFGIYVVNCLLVVWFECGMLVFELVDDVYMNYIYVDDFVVILCCVVVCGKLVCVVYVLDDMELWMGEYFDWVV